MSKGQQDVDRREDRQGGTYRKEGLRVSMLFMADGMYDAATGSPASSKNCACGKAKGGRGEGGMQVDQSKREGGGREGKHTMADSQRDWLEKKIWK